VRIEEMASSVRPEVMYILKSRTAKFKAVNVGGSAMIQAGTVVKRYRNLIFFELLCSLGMLLTRCRLERKSKHAMIQVSEKKIWTWKNF